MPTRRAQKRDLDAYLSPSTVQRGESLELQLASTHRRRSVRFPALRRPLRRREDGESTDLCICKLGVSWVAAGGAMAEEARSVVVLQVTVLFLDGGAPRSSGVDPLPTASPRLCGAVRLVFPFAGGRGTADLAQEHSADAEAQRRDDDGVFRRRSFEIGARRLPACSGGLRIQGVKRSLSSGAPPTALVVSGVVELHKDGFVISFLSRSFV